MVNENSPFLKVQQRHLIQPFINPGNALTATYTCGYHSIFLVPPPHFIQQLNR